jgi:hypothetical protein
MVTRKLGVTREHVLSRACLTDTHALLFPPPVFSQCCVEVEREELLRAAAPLLNDKQPAVGLYTSR